MQPKRNQAIPTAPSKTPLEHQFGLEFDDPTMPKAKEAPASSSIDRMRERVAKMESEEEA